MFRRHTNRVQCFFCQSPAPPHRNSRLFRCTSCGCTNRLDEHGQIISDDPAMHDESMNSTSFAKRATPSNDRLPTMYGKGPFCHTCQTNQTLLVNMLSNYLPAPNNPEYTQRLERFNDYRESLHLRYPPVCALCLPAVEEEIRKKDNMARTKALGGWLNESKGKERQRQTSIVNQNREKLDTELILWRVRGFLWLLNLSVAVIANLCGAIGYRPPLQFAMIQPALPAVSLLAIIWSAWDPTYASLQRAQRQGRDVRLKGKRAYIAMQITVWVSRLITVNMWAFTRSRPHMDLLHIHINEPISPRCRTYFLLSLVLELCALIISCAVLRIQHPPTIRLINPTAPGTRSPTPTSTNYSKTFATISNPVAARLDTLSLHNDSGLPPINPIFGLPSLSGPSPPPKEVDSDEMDWIPTNPSSTAKLMDDNSWLRPQRFFAPENPTGLETLFERTKLVDDTATTKDDRQQPQVESWDGVYNWLWCFCAFLVGGLGGLAYLKARMT